MASTPFGSFFGSGAPSSTDPKSSGKGTIPSDNQNVTSTAVESSSIGFSSSAISASIGSFFGSRPSANELTAKPPQNQESTISKSASQSSDIPFTIPGKPELKQPSAKKSVRRS